jgi:hypothetical protein
MNGVGDKVANVAGAIVTLAVVTTLVAPNSKTAQVVKAFGDAFSGAIRAASGR